MPADNEKLFDDSGPPREPDEPLVLEAEVLEAREINKTTSGISAVREARAEAFVELVRSGVSPTEAAKELSTDKTTLYRDPLVQALANELVTKYQFSANDRRALLRAKLNQVLLTGTTKEALAAARQISQDTEVGVVSGVPATQVNVGVFSDEVRTVIDGVPPLPGETEDK